MENCRYVLIEDCEPLSTFCESLLQKISEFSFQLQTDGNFIVPETWSGGHPYNGDYEKFVSSVKASMQNWLAEYHQKHLLSFDFEKSVFLSKTECVGLAW